MMSINRCFIPFTYEWIVLKNCRSVQTILDVGTGDGRFMQQVNYQHRFSVTGLEIFEKYIQKAMKTGVYRKIIKADITKYKINGRFDAAICSQVIEHMSKNEGSEILRNLEKVAVKVVIIGTPNGYMHQDEYDNNRHQIHKSGWNIGYFRSNGYQVFGQGAKFIYSDNGIYHRVGNNGLLRFLCTVISYVLSPLIYYFPEIGSQLIAVKTLK